MDSVTLGVCVLCIVMLCCTYGLTLPRIEATVEPFDCAI